MLLLTYRAQILNRTPHRREVRYARRRRPRLLWRRAGHEGPQLRGPRRDQALVPPVTQRHARVFAVEYLWFCLFWVREGCGAGPR